MAEDKITFSQVVANRGFRFLWFNQMLMQFATNAINFALIVWIFKLTNSSFAVSALILSIYIPAFLFGIFAGVFVDLTDRKRIIMVVDLGLAICMLMFVVIKDFYPLILLNTFIINSLTQFFIPAESSSIPMLVNKKQLFLANSLFSLTLYSSFMIGYTLAGPTLNIFGIDTIFYAGAVMLFVAFLISQWLPSLKVNFNKDKLKQNIFSLTVNETKQTLSFIRGKLNVMTAILLLSGIQMIIGILAVIIASYMERVLRIQATDASFVLMLPLGLGMVVGAVLVGRLFYKIPRRFVVRPAILSAGLLLFFVGIAPALARFFNNLDFPEYIPHLRYFFDAPSLSSAFAIGAFLLGAATVAVIIPSQTVLQENTAKEIRGKIFAVLAVLMNAFAAIPVILAGALADLFGAPAVFITMGIVVFIIGTISIKPNFFFKENFLPFRLKEFLGLGHWEK